MKKQIVLLTLSAVLIGAAPAIADENYTPEVVGDGAYNVKQLPCDIEIEGNEVPLTDISIYYVDDADGYGYHPCITTTFDISDLSGSERDKVLDDALKYGTFYLDSDLVGIRNLVINYSGQFYNKDKLVCFFYSHTQTEIHFSDAELSSVITIMQNDKEFYTYSISVNGISDIISAPNEISEMPDDEKSWLRDYLKDALLKPTF